MAKPYQELRIQQPVLKPSIIGLPMSGIVEVDPKVKSPRQELEIDNLHRKGSMSKNGNKKQSYDHTFDSIAQDSVFD